LTEVAGNNITTQLESIARYYTLKWPKQAFVDSFGPHKGSTALIGPFDHCRVHGGDIPTSFGPVRTSFPWLARSDIISQWSSPERDCRRSHSRDRRSEEDLVLEREGSERAGGLLMELKEERLADTTCEECCPR
jgi:hypothetical protein